MKLFPKNQRVSNSPSKIRGGARRAGALKILEAFTVMVVSTPPGPLLSKRGR